MDNTLILILEAVVSSGVIWSLVNWLKKVLPVLEDLAPLLAMIVGVGLGLILVTWLGGMSVLNGILSGMFVAGFTSSAYAQKKKITG